MSKTVSEKLRHWLLFNLWYFKNPPWDTGITPPELQEFIQRHPPGRALDLGCGTGTNVIALARAGWQVTGIEFAWRAVHIARRKLRAANVTSAQVLHGDVTRPLPLRQPFDLVLDIGCVHGLPAQLRPAYWDNVVHFLAPGGFYLLYAFLKPENSTGSGLAESEISALQQRLRLLNRQDGFDRPSEKQTAPQQAERRSAWLTFTH